MQIPIFQILQILNFKFNAKMEIVEPTAISIAEALEQQRAVYIAHLSADLDTQS